MPPKSTPGSPTLIQFWDDAVKGTSALQAALTRRLIIGNSVSENLRTVGFY